MAPEVQIKQLPAQHVLLTRTTVTMATIGGDMGAAFDTPMRHAAATGAQFTGPTLVLYPQMPDGEFEIEVCLPVLPGAAAGPDVEVAERPGVEAATLLYKGPYDGMESSWRQLMAWVADTGRPFGGPMREAT